MYVAFVTPASHLHKSFLYRMGHTIYEPSNSVTGPLILGKILTDAGHSVAVYEELYKKLPLDKIMKADVIGISTMTSTAPRAYELATYFRSYKKRVIMGGFHVSSMPEEAIRYCDQVVVGEAESVIKDVVEGTNTDKIVRGTPVEELDAIPFPDYSLLKSPGKIANFLTSRGCTHTCTFCTTTRMFHPYRKMSPEKVVEAIQLYRQAGFERVNIQDDNFTADKERAKRILSLIIRNNLTFKETFFFGRIDIADDEELVMLCKRAGFKIVLVGMESTSSEALAKIRKRQSADNVFRNAKCLTDAGLKLSASIILGLDGDTEESIGKTADFCRDIGAYSLQMPILTPFPGTPLFRQLDEEERILPVGWEYFDMMHTVYRPQGISPVKLQKLFNRIILRFFSFRSVGTVWRKWGVREAMKRFGLVISFRIGALFFLLRERTYLTILKKHGPYASSDKKTGRKKITYPFKPGFRMEAVTYTKETSDKTEKTKSESRL